MTLRDRIADALKAYTLTERHVEECRADTYDCWCCIEDSHPEFPALLSALVVAVEPETLPQLPEVGE